jgi:DNA-binding transcriptional MerR regulator
MALKTSYSSREVAALTGLTARQLQWWEQHGIVTPAVRSRRTDAGGYTERRYSPVDVLELTALARLRRQGFSLHQLRTLLGALRRHFHVRLFDAIAAEGPVSVLTDGRDLYARGKSGEFYDLLRAPDQPLLVPPGASKLRQVSAKARAKRKRQG